MGAVEEGARNGQSSDDSRKPEAGASGGQSQPAVEMPMTPESVLKLLNAQIDGLLSEPPTEAEVARGRSVALGRERLRHERARDRAFLLAWYEAMGAGAEFDDALSARLAAVSREDVLRAAGNYLCTRASIIIVPGP